MLKIINTTLIQPIIVVCWIMLLSELVMGYRFIKDLIINLIIQFIKIFKVMKLCLSRKELSMFWVKGKKFWFIMGRLTLCAITRDYKKLLIHFLGMVFNNGNRQAKIYLLFRILKSWLEISNNLIIFVFLLSMERDTKFLEINLSQHKLCLID